MKHRVLACDLYNQTVGGGSNDSHRRGRWNEHKRVQDFGGDKNEQRNNVYRAPSHTDRM